ncbi:alpha/beta hydrolase [Acinetobacter sp. NIPH 1852]|uniref:alpha/beta fold hydrolase n=1 Tax=Acinetobacter sp. NIPH 1852 TaxID=2923428 RepID=UPI001F4A5700|nr:alpha/beta hydrolase [Acinetobacter sp. NIPH 1852]MCH7308419.1 alpha/beta hydrolase [Acinetobacter sp. NIPH 1852]
MMTLIDILAKYPVKTIEVNGQVQAYREAGQGQPLILLHGISSGSASWVNQLDMLSHHFHVIAWDAPGYGISTGLNTEQPNAADYAQRVLGLMDALAIQKAIVVGHSLGALQASAFAHLYPERVQTLIIANVAQGYQRADDETKAQVYQKRPNMLKSLGNAGMAESRGPHLIYKQEAQALALVNEVMSHLTLDGFTRASYLLAYDEIRNYLTNINVPCVVIAGDKDEITPAQAIKELAIEMQLSRCHLITDAGHLSYVDQPEQFNDIVLSAN